LLYPQSKVGATVRGRRNPKKQGKRQKAKVKSPAPLSLAKRFWSFALVEECASGVLSPKGANQSSPGQRPGIMDDVHAASPERAGQPEAFLCWGRGSPLPGSEVDFDGPV